MVKLLVPVNYKGVIHEPGIAYFDEDYENLLVKNGNATFELKEEEKPKTTKATRKTKE